MSCRIIKLFKQNQIKLSLISIGKLEYGVSKSPNRERNRIALLDFSSCFDIVDFTDNYAVILGIIRSELGKKGQVIGSYDLQIASQAISRNLIVVITNIKEFSKVSNLSILYKEKK